MTPQEYIAASGRTVPESHAFHLDMLTDRYPEKVFSILYEVSQAAQKIDKVKKTLVYGRPLPTEPVLVKIPTPIPKSPKGEVPLPVIHGIIGLLSEAGEMADILITSWFGQDQLDTLNLKEELGDIFWYMARICRYMQEAFPDEDWSFEAVMSGNIAKLASRHKVDASGHGFNPDAVDHANRDKDAERAAIAAASSTPVGNSASSDNLTISKVDLAKALSAAKFYDPSGLIWDNLKQMSGEGLR